MAKKKKTLEVSCVDCKVNACFPDINVSKGGKRKSPPYCPSNAQKEVGDKAIAKYAGETHRFARSTTLVENSCYLMHDDGSAVLPMVTLHPRTRTQGFTGKAQWNHLRTLKDACPVPVIGSGDLFSAQDCLRMISTTGCDGVMIARGCLGNPFIFAQAEALLQGHAMEPRIGPGERLSTAIAQLLMLARSVGEAKACRDMRKHFVAYTKGLEGASIVRQSVVHADCIDEYEEIVESYLRQ